jgi:acid phosphatase
MRNATRNEFARSLLIFLFLALCPSCKSTPTESATTGSLTLDCEVSTDQSLPNLFQSSDAFKTPTGWNEIKRVFIVILENTDAAVALSQPFMGSLPQMGAYLTNYHGVTHPSQPNYIALISGDTQGVTTNDNVDLKERHIGNLLSEAGKDWKTYAEDYPGDCFQKSTSGKYARRHTPFISFKNVTESESECAKIVSATQLDSDVAHGSLPEFSLFIPNNNNNGHDTSATQSDQWLSQRFGPLLKNPAFMSGTLFVVTFDESLTRKPNHIFTVLLGAGIKPGTTSNLCYDHYSLLATTEKILKIGTLEKKDSKARIIDEIWKDDASSSSLTTKKGD